MISRLEIEVTRKCNLRCLHCSVRASPAVSSEEMSFNHWARILKEFISLGGKEVVITGGEPTLYGDFLGLVQFVKSKKLSIRLYSSGILIDTHFVRLLSPNDIVCVSLEGDRTDHEAVTQIPGSYDKTINGLKLLRSFGVRVRLHFTPMKINFADFRHVVRVASAIGAESIKILKFVPEGRGKDNEELLKLSEKQKIEFEKSLSEASATKKIPLKYGGKMVGDSKCSVGTKLSITSDGLALPCLGLRGQTWLSLGNVKEQSLQRISARLDQVTGDLQCICGKIHAYA